MKADPSLLFFTLPKEGLIVMDLATHLCVNEANEIKPLAAVEGMERALTCGQVGIGRYVLTAENLVDPQVSRLMADTPGWATWARLAETA